jgi:hypothetical protein
MNDDRIHPESHSSRRDWELIGRIGAMVFFALIGLVVLAIAKLLEWMQWIEPLS